MALIFSGVRSFLAFQVSSFIKYKIALTSTLMMSGSNSHNALQLIWFALPKKAIDNALKDYRKWLYACVSANSGHFKHLIL